MHRNAVSPLILLLILAFAVAGCGRSDQDAEDGAPAAGNAAPERGEDTTPPVPMRLTDEGAARAEAGRTEAAESSAPPVQTAERAAVPAETPQAPPPPAAQPRAASPSRPADPRDTAFAELRFQFTVLSPYDAELGPLQHAFVGSISDRSAYAAARTFLGLLLDGELPEDSLDVSLGRGARSLLAELLWKAPERAEVRIGEVYQLSDVDVSLTFRLFGEADEAIGELILTNRDGRWYTSDVQVAYRARASDSRFDPASRSARARR